MIKGLEATMLNISKWTTHSRVFQMDNKWNRYSLGSEEEVWDRAKTVALMK